LRKFDRYCSIVFDEITLSASLQYTNEHAKVIGFKDLGGFCRKQSISFYLTNGTMDSINLSNKIKDIIKAVQSTGFAVASTICDQTPTNVAAINKLYKETNEKFNKENRAFGFEIETQEIIPLYDIPHLLKTLRNNFVSKYLHYVYENKNIVKLMS